MLNRKDVNETHGSGAFCEKGRMFVFLFLLEGVLAYSLFFKRLGYGLFPHLAVTFGCVVFGLCYWGRSRYRVPVSKSWRAIQYIVVAYAVWAVISNILQPKYFEANVSFGIVWSLNMIVISWIIPRAIYSYDVDDRRELLLVFLEIVIYASVACLAIYPMPQGRFAGVWGNATISGRFFAYAMIFAFCQLLFVGIRKRYLALFAVSVVGLLLTRTRASIGGGVIALSVVLVLAYVQSRQSKKVKKRCSVAGLTLVLCVMCFAGYSEFGGASVRERFLDHFRLSQGLDDEFESARAMNWEAGVQGFYSAGLYGEGFMSKYAGTSESVVYGITIPRYDWTQDNDPLNSLFSITKQLGYVGGLLHLCLLFYLFRSLRHISEIPVRGFLLGFLVIGMVWGFADGNWLTSFGDPIDRLSLVTFALFISPRRNRAAVAALSQ